MGNTGLEQASTLGEPIGLGASTWIGSLILCDLAHLLWFLINHSLLFSR